MLKLQTGYSMFFNTKYERNGSLFQGPFKSTRADTDRYLQYLFSYIHLNPAKLKDKNWKEKAQNRNELMRFVESYPYSSYQAYLNDSHSITDPKAFPEYFSSKEEVRGHIVDWLTQEDAG
jgi:outer membrane protein assembly factor BamD (BamD/ComL family)